MCMESLKMMKQSLIACAQGQMNNLAEVDAKELGEVIDMIKDLEEAMYYCTITEAMEKKDKEESGVKEYHYFTQPRYNERDMDKDNGRMYYTSPMYYGGNGSSSSSGSGSSGRGGGSSSSGSGGRYYTDQEDYMMRDPREGRSHQTRKTYMESKQMHRDKASQLKELEKYMQELTQDMVEMIEDASPEEKQYLEKRVSALASKIGQVK